MRRRVFCLYDNSAGYAVEHLGRNRYRVEWDDPTPLQHETKVTIPSAIFVWADENSQ